MLIAAKGITACEANATTCQVAASIPTSPPFLEICRDLELSRRLLVCCQLIDGDRGAVAARTAVVSGARALRVDAASALPHRERHARAQGWGRSKETPTEPELETATDPPRLIYRLGATAG